MDELEIWKDCPSHLGVKASSLGRIKLPELEVSLPNGGSYIRATKPTFGSKSKASKNAKHEYFNIFNRKLGNLKVHQLVCEAFHGPKPFEKSVVIHIDENSLNNRASNLKWGTQKENLNMPIFIKYCQNRIGENSPIIKNMRKNK